MTTSLRGSVAGVEGEALSPTDPGSTVHHLCDLGPVNLSEL